MKAIYRHSYHCGSLAMVMPDFRWDLTLPDGHHVRGQATDLDAAKAVLEAEYTAFALRCWMRGRLQAKGRMDCPTSDRQR